ncbi:MAG: CBS domain-containing protein [Salibacteraceae bacterium]
MGEQDVTLAESRQERQKFIRHLLNDVKALDRMLEAGQFETGIQRIGAEQEFCLVDRSWRPAPLSSEVLQHLNDDHFTTELAKFNIEINLDPLEFKGDCFHQMETQLNQLLEKANFACSKEDAKVLLTGILPSIRRSDLELENLTPNPRYLALNEVMTQLKGGEFEFHISGTDELITRHNTVRFEACNTSFQVHLQVDPDDFVAQYNWSQAISGPLLAAMTNSPLLLSKRLWAETRIALFQQSLDLRQLAHQNREGSPRVFFGEHWVDGSVAEVIKEDVSRYKLLLSAPLEEESLKVLDAGQIPKLTALKLHNGTIYKWNRPCYGVMNGKPHLRIESRYIPAGPTVLDEMANTAFWLGCMRGMPEEYRDIAKHLEFDDAKRNFFRAARMGIGAQFKWMGGRQLPSQEVLLKEMLPIAREGLSKVNIDPTDIDRYLGVIEERVSKQRTGAHWLVDSFEKLKKVGTRDEAIVSLTAGHYNRQITGLPVHEWDLAGAEEGGNWSNRFQRIDQIMSTDLFTVQEDDLLELVTNIMTWRKIRHLPVENDAGELVGLVTTGGLLRKINENPKLQDENIVVKDCMATQLFTVTPETLTKEALKLMRENSISCLPVVRNQQLIGIVTEYDFARILEHLFEELE